VIGALWPRVVAWPLAVITLWLGVSWAIKAYALRRARRTGTTPEPAVRLDDVDG
jgi:hypothetical protein